MPDTAGSPMHSSLPRPSAAADAPLANGKGCWSVVSVPGIGSVETALARQQALADEVDATVRPVLMLWRCHQALLVSRTETRLPRFQQACIELASTGWPVVLRRSGGSACPIGPGTVQVSTIELAAPEETMEAKYAALAGIIQSALRAFGIESRTGTVAEAYCPGRFDVTVDGKKIAGISQRWFRNRNGVRYVTTAASVNVEQAPEQLAAVVNHFYDSAGSNQRCAVTALTSMRLSHATPLVAGQDSVAAAFDRGHRGRTSWPDR